MLLLEKVELMFSMIRNEINYIALPANELVCALSLKDDMKKLKFINSCAIEISKGEDFPVAWKKSLNSDRNTSYLRQKDIQLLCAFGESFGITDSEGQLSNCNMYLELLKVNRNEAIGERDRYSKTVSLLGLLAGLGLIIVLL